MCMNTKNMLLQEVTYTLPTLLSSIFHMDRKETKPLNKLERRKYRFI